ncbi:MAG: EAL domain-containing protein [Helicobacteraceae bacterium]|jgi:PAS domain S-box-containing protein/diguanylate cyclase (GGDEF)-like protein|nr:EAL domain-containing protein [Helicobacteraceae bacterium]
MSEQDTKELLKTLRVLYVEDDHAILEAMQKPLSRYVGELYMAINGKEGLHIFDLYKPDIVVTDIRMPVMDGLAMAREIRASNPHTPIIIVSAFNEVGYLGEALDIGVSQYVLKPINIDRLFEALERCVRQMMLENEVLRKNDELNAAIKMLTEYSRAIDISTIVSRSDSAGVITFVNPAFCEAFGYASEEIIGKGYDVIAHPKISKKEVAAIEKALAQKTIYKGIVRNRRKDGHSLYSNLTIVPIVNDDGDIVEVIDMRYDVTQLVSQIYTDPLTGFPNRIALVRDIVDMPLPLVILLNIVSFGEINDFYGNHIGDELLNRVTRTLSDFLKQGEVTARAYKLSSDEFAVLVDDYSQCNGVREFVYKLHSYMEHQSYQFNDFDVVAAFTAGYTIARTNLLAKADMALRCAKRSRKAIACYESLENAEKDYERNIVWTKRIKHALDHDRVVPWFQPIVNISTGEVVKYECLMRIVDEEGAVHEPPEFLSVAYRSRLYFKMARAMIKKSCEYFQDKPVEFSVNMTIGEILNQEMTDFLKSVLKETATAHHFVIELLEGESIERYPEIEQFIQEMKGLGCKIAIDDFGSGYSNFDHLLKFHIDYLKIDGDIIAKVDNDRVSLVTAETIASFAKKLGIKAIAEHVHTEQIGMVVSRLGIDYAQGFLYSKPTAQIA